MKIELQEPFKSIWKYGYLRINRENRKALDLFNSNENRTTISYARYLMCVKLGYNLSSEFEVDHIDNDKTNDDINNLLGMLSQSPANCANYCCSNPRKYGQLTFKELIQLDQMKSYLEE